MRERVRNDKIGCGAEKTRGSESLCRERASKQIGERENKQEKICDHHDLTPRKILVRCTTSPNITPLSHQEAARKFSARTFSCDASSCRRRHLQVSTPPTEAFRGHNHIMMQKPLDFFLFFGGSCGYRFIICLMRSSNTFLTCQFFLAEVS